MLVDGVEFTFAPEIAADDYQVILDCNFFTAVELYNEFTQERIAEQYLNEDCTPKDPTKDVPHFEVLTSTMACCPGFEMVVKIRDYYNSVEATPERALHYRDWVNNDRLVATYLTEYGFKYIDKTQLLDNEMIVFGTGLFGYPWGVTDKYEVSYHFNAATWNSDNWSSTIRKEYMYDKFGLLPLYKLYKKIKNRIKSR